jgi:hypothetical protein
MNAAAPTCAICDQPIDGASRAHAVRDKFVCDACRQLQAPVAPRPVLPYSDQGLPSRRRRFLSAAAIIVGVALLLAMLLGIRQVQRERERALLLRALAQQQALVAQKQAELARAIAARANAPATQPSE